MANGNKQAGQRISPSLTLLLATACGIIVANLYYAQPLVGLISKAIGLSPSSAGLIVTLTQIGYVAGLLFLVPLGDIIENKKLIVVSLLLSAAALTLTAFVKHGTLFLAAAFSSDWDQSQPKCLFHLHHTLHQTLHAAGLLAMS